MSAAENRQLIIDELDHLPPLHQVAQKLIALLNDDRSSARDLDKLIRNDQALTARVLKLANSATYGKSRQIFQLAEAVVLLGHGTLTNIVMGVSVADVMGGALDHEFTSRAWSHSLDCAAVAQSLAEITAAVPPEQAFVAGLLHDIGLLVEARAVPEALQSILAAEPGDQLGAERDAMGINHAQVGLKLLDRWRLPQALCEAVRLHHAPKPKHWRTNPLVNIVALADQLTRIVGTAPFPEQQGRDLFSQLRLLGITADRYPSLFGAMARSRRNMSCLLNAVDLADSATNEAESSPAAVDPIGLYAADERRRDWYAAALDYLERPAARPGDERAPIAALIDFHGASPDERDQVDRAARAQGLVCVVVGDRRHSPDSEFWQSAPHLPVLFTQVQLRGAFGAAAAAAGARAPEPIPAANLS